ncbi:MAG: hypothetical protein JO056_10265 [Alphaproteobacteria bacterium]|nr:hypothetical protein [Alphaproteobacteria bacterium]
MNTRLLPLAALVALGIAAAPAAAAPATPHFKMVRPLFRTVPHNAAWHRPGPPAAQLVQWNGSFTDQKGMNITYTMVGTDPATTNTKTTIPVVIVPLKLVFGKANGDMTFDPGKTRSANGKTVLKDLIASPLFKSNIRFVQGGVDLGKTQYIDAYQRGNFWNANVKDNPNYHVLLGNPTVLPTQTLKVSPAAGLVMTNPFGTEPVGTYEVDLFDKQIVKIIKANPDTITPDVFPLFVSSNVFLTEGFAVCCIGGYHSSIGSQPAGQTYGYATYETEAGSFSQDVSAFSHEVGEWMDDPFVDNNVNCTDNTLMENGDPLENNANYGDFAYNVGSRTYNLQSLVFIGYFGAPPSTSVNNWLSFQNEQSTVCPGQ